MSSTDDHSGCLRELLAPCKSGLFRLDWEPISMRALGSLLDQVQKNSGFDISLAIDVDGSFPSLL